MSIPRPETLEAEQQVIEAGLTLGELNQRNHAVVESNRHLLSVESGHLRFEQGRGVVKIQEADCSLCEIRGYNDGKWRRVEGGESS